MEDVGSSLTYGFLAGCPEKTCCGSPLTVQTSSVRFRGCSEELGLARTDS